MKNYTINEFIGGVSGQRNKGPRGSFSFGQNLDIHNDDGLLTTNQKLKKDSGDIVVDLPLAMFRASDGAMYAFGNTGKIYRKASDGSWILAYTDTDGKITGASEYENNNGGGSYSRYIYWATRYKLKRILLSSAGGEWSPTEVGTFKVAGLLNYHTMRVAAGWLMIADGDRVAIVDREDAFNNEALLISTGNTIKPMIDKSEQLIMGTQDDVLNGWIFTWNKLLDSWTDKTPVQAKEVNAIGFLEGGLLMQVGQRGRLKWWNFSDSHPLKKIPDTNYAEPGAVDEYRGMLHIGMSGGTKDGVYSIGREDNNNPLAVNLEYIPSHGKITGGVIGAMAKDGSDLYVAWKYGKTYGIDMVDSNNKANGLLESLEFDGGQPETTKRISTIKVITKPLPANCTISVKYKTNRDTDWIETEMSDGRSAMDEGDIVGIFNAEAEGESYQVQLTLTASANNAPEIYSINNYFTEGTNL